MQFAVLGPLQAVRDERSIPLGGPKQRLVLAALVAARGQPVSTAALIDALWPEEPPKTARKTLQGYVHGLRTALGDAVATEASGYSLQVEPEQIDAVRFEQLHHEAKSLLDVDPRRASELIEDALGLWRGSAYSDLEHEPFLTPTIAQLEESRLDAVADRIDADLALGSHHELVGELTSLTHDYPLRERFTSQLMTALYRAGRHAEALRAYSRTRHILREELGIEPSAELGDLESRILARDAELDGPPRDPRATAKAVRGYELRRLVAEDKGRAVYEGYQRSLGRRVAVTVTGPPLANDPDFIARFHTDSERLAGLVHPNIVFLHDTWREPDRAYQVTRWVDGSTLTERLSDGPLPRAEAMRALSQIGGALSSAHQGGIAHGRLSSESVLISDEGDYHLGGFAIGSDGADARSDQIAFAALAHDMLFADTRATDDGDDLLTEVVDFGRQGQFDRIEDFVHALRQVGAADPTEPPLSDEPEPYSEVRNPYKGLQAFQQTDANDFFGREELTDKLQRAVLGHRLVAVVGPSGAGKSSVVRAGLAAGLEASDGRWLVATMFPGAFPFEELAGALVCVAVKDVDLTTQLTADERGLSRVLKMVLPEGESEVLLVIDQFEELFSMVEDEATRALFLANILTAVTDPRSRLRVVITLRADFFGRPLEYPEFGAMLERGLVPISMPDTEGLTRAIAEPAARVGLEIEPRLTNEIVRDVGDQPGGLPLLQFTLTELFRRRTSNRMTIAAYEESGGVYGALEPPRRGAVRRADPCGPDRAPPGDAPSGHGGRGIGRHQAEGVTAGAEDTRGRPGGHGRGDRPVRVEPAAHVRSRPDHR